jgi:hypothetical protein
MRQSVLRRLTGLETIRAAATARQSRKSPDYHTKIAELIEQTNRWHADPVNQEWLAAQPATFLPTRMQELRRALERRAFGVAA